MSTTDIDDEQDRVVQMPAKVGYGSPPVHSRFQPGQSGNPSGRPKGGQNLKTLFNKILNEEVSLREGTDVRKISKAEAVLRGVVVGALRGDARSLMMLVRLAEQAGGFEDKPSDINKIDRLIITWEPPGETSDAK
jgi:hypothetical protein